MEKKIEKPITIVRQELIEAISNDINNSNLPLFIVEPILKDMYLEIKSLSQRQYVIDKNEYESKLKLGDANEERKETNGN